MRPWMYVGRSRSLAFNDDLLLPHKECNACEFTVEILDQNDMAGTHVKLRQSTPMPDWLPKAILLPSVLSIVTHAVMLFVFATTIRSCHQAPVGFTSEESREIGIVIKDVGNNPDAVVPGEPRDGEATESIIDERPTTDSFAPTQATPDQPPVETSLPRYDSADLIGPGVNLPVGAGVTDPRQPVKSGGGQRPAATGTLGGPPGAAFMGTRDQGAKVVFVVDASGSMTAHNSMQVAKSALVSSLQSLEGNQQFLIIFYDDKPAMLDLRGIRAPQLYSATEINKTLARQKIAGIQPGTGTQHVPALEMALQLNPDVIFFLTDGQEPPIHPKELEQLRQQNVRKTRIHCIEFGVGQEISESVAPNNFLRKLSRQNGGTYRYFDVTKFKAN